MHSIELQPGADIAEQYEREGVVQVPALFTPDEVDEMREVFTAQVERDPSLGFDDGVPEGDVLARYPRLVHPHRRRELAVGRLARRHMLDRRLLDRVEALIGPALAAQSMFYFKPPSARGAGAERDARRRCAVLSRQHGARLRPQPVG